MGVALESEAFDPRRVRFADIDGTGATDLVYIGHGTVSYWCNQAGNAWSAARKASASAL